MRRDKVEREMKEVLGRTPAVLDRVPDELLGAEWQLLRRQLVDESLIPGRYRALIGVSVGAALRCASTARLHTRLARAQGASEAEVAEAVHHAAQVAGWSARIHGFGLDFEEHEAEAAGIAEHLAARLAID